MSINKSPHDTLGASREAKMESLDLKEKDMGKITFFGSEDTLKKLGL